MRSWLPAMGAALRANAQAAKIEESDPAAKAVKYVHDASKLDPAKNAPFKAGSNCANCQFFTAAGLAFSHGANDAQKTMGIIALALVSAEATGTLASLSAGDLAYAAGLQWRRETFVNTPSPASATGDIAGLGGAGSPVDRKRTIQAAYGELNAPLLKGLDANLALRRDDYDDVGWDDALLTGGIILGSAIILDEIFDDDDWDGWDDDDVGEAIVAGAVIACVALIIGVGQYQHAPEYNVPQVVGDARAVDAVLRDQRAQLVAMLGHPARRIRRRGEPQDRRLAGYQLDLVRGREGSG